MLLFLYISFKTKLEEDILIREANFNDVDSIMDIIKQIIAEMKESKNTQWDETYPKAENFKQDIEEGSLYVDEFKGDIVGFICVNDSEPEEYKNIDWISDEKSLVLHRMGINPKYRRKGKAKNLIRYAENLAMRNGIMYLKTDTNSMNTKMRSLFKTCGFRFAGEMDFLGKPDPFYCYDLKLNV